MKELQSQEKLDLPKNFLQSVRIMPSLPSFFPQFSLFIARPPVLGTMLNCIIMLSRLLRQHMARAYGQDTLYWL